MFSSSKKKEKNRERHANFRVNEFPLALSIPLCASPRVVESLCDGLVIVLFVPKEYAIVMFFNASDILRCTHPLIRFLLLLYIVSFTASPFFPVLLPGLYGVRQHFCWFI
ncbi:unnamed protein product [Citrullus colocynthis]|uniref:Uncharacterized protein n=1 Tax=Citrullus colocynthis TaxID=252529 RepID=A0ABP0XWR1_9ROSI